MTGVQTCALPISRSAAPRTSSGKKLPLPVQVTIRDIVTGELYEVPNPKGHSAAKPPSPPGQPDTKQDTKENKPDQGRQPSISPASAASAQNQTEDQTKDQTEAQQPAQAEQQNEQNKPQQNRQNCQDKPQPNGHSALSPAPPSAQPVSPPPQENQSVPYPPGLGPRYLAVATPSMPWWRKQRINQGFVAGTAPQTAEMRVPAARFRGTRP